MSLPDSNIPKRIYSELYLISMYLQTKNWDDPKTYDNLITDAVELIKETLNERAKVVFKSMKD